MRALILAGGDLTPSERIRSLLDCGLVVAADSGLRHARPLGLDPDVILGDFDSVAVEDLAAHPGTRQIRHPVQKDELDLELAIEYVREQGADEITILGAFGSRLDQTLAALLIAGRLRKRGLRVGLHDGLREAYMLTEGDVVAPLPVGAHAPHAGTAVDLPEGTHFSLLALEDAIVSVQGAQFELDRKALQFGVGLGLANRSAGAPRIVIHSGLVVLLIDWAPEV